MNNLEAQNAFETARPFGDGAMALARQYIRENRSYEDFQHEFMKEFRRGIPVEVDPEIGLNRAEREQYSIVKAIRTMANGGKLEGLEKECSDTIVKRFRKDLPVGQFSAFYAPHDVMVHRNIRALEAGVFTAGGALVGTQTLGSIIELYRNAMYVAALGATPLSGLVGDVAIPRQSGGATAYWLSETATLTASQQAVGQLELKPHRLAAATAYSNQLLAQTSEDVETFVRQDLAQVVATERDKSSIQGTGVSGQPLGIVNTTGVLSVTIAGAQSVSYANAVSFETALSTNNSLRQRLGYLATPTVKHNAKIQAQFTNGDTPVWQGGEVGTMNGYPAAATLQVPAANSCIFGNWAELLLADWAGLLVIVDPFSLALANQTRVIYQQHVDNGIRRAVSFAVANQ